MERCSCVNVEILLLPGAMQGVSSSSKTPQILYFGIHVKSFLMPFPLIKNPYLERLWIAFLFFGATLEVTIGLEEWCTYIPPAHGMMLMGKGLCLHIAYVANFYQPQINKTLNQNIMKQCNYCQCLHFPNFVDLILYHVFKPTYVHVHQSSFWGSVILINYYVGDSISWWDRVKKFNIIRWINKAQEDIWIHVYMQHYQKNGCCDRCWKQHKDEL